MRFLGYEKKLFKLAINGDTMRKKILVKGPALTRSGYGEQCRFALRALRKYEEFFDIYLEPLNWGQTGWLADDTEERNWMDGLVGKTIVHHQGKGQFDISLQVTIPQEWDNLAPVNIGYTAGTETTKISGQWIEKANVMDKIITVSDHTKHAFENSTYDVIDNKTGEKKSGFRCVTPLHTVNFATRNIEPSKLDVDFEYDFNFLVLAQWSVRKNIENTVRWFIEEFKDTEVGLVIKASTVNGSIMDSETTRKKLKDLIDDTKGKRKCKIYLLHGDLTDGELASLYQHPKIKSLINLAHGEGFGLPMFEAAQHELPVVAPSWSGHLDFLYAPKKEKKTNKIKMRPHFGRVEYTLQPIQDEAVWEPVLIKDSMWCFPRKLSYKKVIKDVYENYGRYKKQAKTLKKYIAENFSPEKQYKEFAELVYGEKMSLEAAEYVFVSDLFADEYVGGAELSLESLINKTPVSHTKIKSVAVTEKHTDFYKDSKWIFGNYSQLNLDVIDLLIKKNINYSIVEFDYKICKYRNLELHNLMEGKECDCVPGSHGETVTTFLKSASNIFFMSEEQMSIHLNLVKDLDQTKCTVLSSVFEDTVIDKIKDLREGRKGKKEDFWVVPTGQLWVKGADKAKEWCANNNLEFVELQNVSYMEALETLSRAKGLCFLPAGADTCPRMVIEAKLLGCELNLNDNVQHAKEKWFETQDLEETENYLRNVTNKFWEYVG